jgi:hypothetical protein
LSDSSVRLASTVRRTDQTVRSFARCCRNASSARTSASVPASAEDILAGEEAAYAPIYHYTAITVTKPWLTRNFPALGGNDYFNWTVDTASKMAATGQ